VVTGKSPETGEFLEGVPCRPSYLIVRGWVDGIERAIKLHSDNDIPLWRELADKVEFEGKKYIADVVIIPVEMGLFSVYPQVVSGFQAAFIPFLSPTSEVTVVGYPYHRDRPIWKTCHVAEMITERKTYFLINGRTKEGMSGSPVFDNRDLPNNAHGMVGIYSGRYNDKGVNETLNELDIGIVWYIGIVVQLMSDYQDSVSR
jgi:hypothetical protein